MFLESSDLEVRGKLVCQLEMWEENYCPFNAHQRWSPYTAPQKDTNNTLQNTKVAPFQE